MPSNFMCAFIFQLKNKYGDAFLRGNNVKHVLLV
ncbi:hypothetical protein pdam_00004401 [Pocillopora damicornis]|uniref:Uncharacterized protein n=1 Tax=Pocillopora damicornis TaxID=46731 RepID=A0A3M6UIL9_POCDA|nr:hypothetical protein pdam_00004401 [Pocillopora damicornis]